MNLKVNLRADTHHSVRGVPKANFASVRTSLGRDPRCRNSVDLSQQEENETDVPRSEGRPLAVQALMSVSDDVKPNRHGDKEDTVWVALQTDNYINDCGQ